MKKLVKTIFFTCIVCITVSLSQSAKAQFSAGAQAGVNFATEPALDIFHVFLARPYAGVYGQYQLGIPFSIQVGANYSGEGANYKDLSTGDTYQVRHSFLTIPLLAQYKFHFGGYIELGPQLGFLLSAKERANDDAFTDTKQYYKGNDVGGLIGIGYEFKGKTLAGFGLNARYYRDLTALNKTPVEGGEDVKSRVLSVGLTYRLGVKK